MKATGVVRKIDDLGRIVIPKEVRRTLRINRGDPLELYIDSDSNIIFKKYSLIEEISKIINCLCEAMYKIVDLPILICNNEKVVTVSGISKKEYLNRRLAPFISEFVSLKDIYICDNNPDSRAIFPVEGIKKEALLIAPINLNKNSIGTIIVLKNNKESQISIDFISKLVDFVVVFLSKFEE